MDLQHCLGWRVALLLFLLPCGGQFMWVHILTQEPAHVIPGNPLVLQARIEPGPLEKISMVTWEREPETGSTPGKVKLACAGKSPNCSGEGERVSLDQQGATLKLKGYTREDSGVYMITVMDQTGVRTSAQCIVREYEAVHHVSVSINVSHSSLVCGEAWGTDPLFSWLHERAAITKNVGDVSKDGKILYVSHTPICGHFTCMVANQLGYSTATYTAAPCETATENRGTAVAVTCLVIILVFGGLLSAFFLWRRHRRGSNRGERLHEHLDDNI